MFNTWEEGRKMRRWLLAASCAALGMAQTAEIKNPLTSPKDVEAGAKIFRSHCAECHGLRGEGGRGPSLATGEFFHGSSDADLLRNISDGIPGTEMPGTFFSPTQVWQAAAYVRSLGEAGNKETVAGDRAKGAELFRGKGGCTACHLMRGEGGRQGPDLSYIGTQRSAAHLTESILNPSARVEMEWWEAKVATSDGKRYGGYVLDEDTHSIRILDTQDRLLSLPKSKVKAIEIDKSSKMPSYQGKLSEAEVYDIVAYLKSLRREAEVKQ